MTQKIGFTGLYYTLWHVTEPYRKYKNQFEYDVVQDYTYIQNLSTDITQAKAKLKGEFVIDLNLKGDEGWSFSSVIASNVTVLEHYHFSFGKLAGQDMRNTNDVWQLKRASESERGLRRRAIARRRLIELGIVVRYEGRWMTKEEADKIKKQMEDQRQIYGHHFKNEELVKLKVKIISHRDLKNRYGYFAIVEYIDTEFRRFKYMGSSPCIYKQERDKDGATIYSKITEWHDITAEIEHTYNNGRLETKLKRIKLFDSDRYPLQSWQMKKITTQHTEPKK